MKLAWCIVGIIGITAALAFAGCEKADRAAETTPAKTATPLPEWAPENPSPEFLRAAKVLTPIPTEGDGMENEILDKVLTEKWERVSVPAWEFFGTLSDEQVNRLFTSKPINVGGRPASVSRAMRLPYK